MRWSCIGGPMHNGDLVMAKICYCNGEKLPENSFIIFRQMSMEQDDVGVGDLLLSPKKAYFYVSKDFTKVLIRAADAQ
jgi:hypothetical protein